MHALAILLGIILVALNLYVNYLYYQLNVKGIIQEKKRISFSILKRNLVKEENAEYRMQIHKCLKIYRIFFVLFCFEIFIIVYILVNVISHQ